MREKGENSIGRMPAIDCAERCAIPAQADIALRGSCFGKKILISKENKIVTTLDCCDTIGSVSPRSTLRRAGIA